MVKIIGEKASPFDTVMLSFLTRMQKNVSPDIAAARAQTMLDMLKVRMDRSGMTVVMRNDLVNIPGPVLDVTPATLAAQGITREQALADGIRIFATGVGEIIPQAGLALMQEETGTADGQPMTVVKLSTMFLIPGYHEAEMARQARMLPGLPVGMPLATHPGGTA